MIENKLIYIDYANIRYKIDITEKKSSYLISNDSDSADIYINSKSFEPFTIEIGQDNTSIDLISNNGLRQTLSFGTTVNLNNAEVTLYRKFDDYRELYIGSLEGISFGGDISNNVIFKECSEDCQLTLSKKGEGWILSVNNPDKMNVYINGIKCSALQDISNGDVISYKSYIIVFFTFHCIFYHQYRCIFNNVIDYSVESERKDGYPYFKRSPRIFYNSSDKKIIIPNPAAKAEENKNSLIMAIAPNLLMVATTIGTGLLMGRGIMVLIMGIASLATMVTTISKFFSDKKKQQEREQTRIDYYGQVLDSVRKQIRTELELQRTSLEKSFPSLADEHEIVSNFSMRLWEKNPEHHDFLNVRIGIGSKPLSFSVEYSSDDNEQNEKDPLHNEAKELASKNTEISNVPVSLDLATGITGIVGNKENVAAHLFALITHLCTFHSYKDVQLVVVYPEAQEESYYWMKWLPHTWIGKNQFKGMIRDSRTRDNILGSIYQIIKARRNDLKESTNKNVVFPTRIVFVIADLQLIFDHPIMEFLSYNQSEIGVYSIYLADRFESLPESTSNILQVDEYGKGTIIKEKNTDSQKSYIPDLSESSQLEPLARKMAPIQHVSSVSNNIPNSVTLFQLYKIEKLEEYNILSRWEENKPYKTLAVPLGLRGTDDVVCLNLHEKAHGPHGLVAGTTGSGKSETIQSYIISLAINFHPYDIAFLLIDYKGGGMADLFKNLPHLLGTITNLDGAQTMRALVAIKSENMRRQRVFSEHGVNHIDQYQKLFNEGVVTEPMPHLFIISDEFAELKTEKPEFIKELVSTARIGRSLGVHLILATQKPDGVVDEQINSNSKFRICLKVQNPSDSQSMIKTPDAAYITQPGRGYLLVGNNEIYELFQSAWSGAKYKASQGGEEISVDDNIYHFNDLGQTQLMTEDFSKNVTTEKQSEVVTQLEASVNYINDVFGSMNLARVPSPWLPPLAPQIYLPNLLGMESMEDMTSLWTPEQKELVCLMGMLDQPQIQAQSTFEINLSRTGHIAVFGSSAMGKSTFLRTIAISTAIKYSPEELNFYLLDFGNNGLIPLSALPHTADVMNIDSAEKISKFERIILSKIKERKKLLGDTGVSNIDMYRKITGNKIPNIIIFIDNFDIIKEQFESLEKTLIEISRDGMACGVFLALTASRSSAVRMNLLVNVKNQIALYMIDKSETSAVVGRTELDAEELPGRGLVKLDSVYSFQTALPTYAETEEEIVENFKLCIQKISSCWKGEKPSPIPMLPEELSLNSFTSYKSVRRSLELKAYPLIPIGLDSENVEALSIDFSKANNMSIVGGPNSGKGNVLKLIVEMLLKTKQNHQIFIFDNMMIKLNAYKRSEGVTYVPLSNTAGVTDVIRKITEDAKNRREKYIEYLQSDGDMSPAQFYSQFPCVFILVNGAAIFAEKADNQNAYAQLLEDVRQTGIHFIFCGNAAEFTKGYDALSKAMKAIDEGILLVPADRQQVWNLPYAATKEKPLAKGEAFYIKGSSYCRIRIPLV